MLLLILLLSGFGIIPSYSYHDYDFVHHKKVWVDALSYCSERDTTLATVEDETQQSILDKITTPSNTGLVWLGLMLNMSYWRWSVDDTKQPCQFYNWGNGQPTENLWRNCVVMVNGQWTTTTCSRNCGQFVCFTQTGDHKTYHIVQKDQTTYYEAREYCQEHHKDLAVIETPGENEEVQKLLHGRKWNWSWIGLTREEWVWPSPTNFKPFRNWAKGQPKVPPVCVAMDLSTKKWQTRKCSTALPFICNAGPRVRRTVLKMQIQSEADLADPAVQAQLLQQLNMALGKQATGVKLRWITPPQKKAKKGKDEL